LPMSTQYCLIRELLCATIALFLGAGLKGFFFLHFDPVKIALARSSG